jgi:hypothetical protein
VTTLIQILRPILSWARINPLALLEGVSKASITWAARSQGLERLIQKTAQIEPDISDQETSGQDTFNSYWELKRRALQAFQCEMMLKATDLEKANEITVVDIGDSSGRHMKYLSQLTQDSRKINALSVNLDPRAIKRIEARGGRAVLVRAEELRLEQPVDLFTTFQMVEHLHNPSIFFRRLANRPEPSRLLVTVPYLRASRLGLHYIRSGIEETLFAEDVHLFELSPEDWKLLMKFSGWKPIFERTYFQYPQHVPFLSRFLRLFWRRFDYEGFWGVILEKDLKLSNQYKDWPGEQQNTRPGEAAP